MRRTLRLLPLALVVGLSASAASADTFTLKVPITLTGAELGNPGVLGTLNPVLDVSGTFGTDPGGLGSFAGVDVFVIDVTLTAGSTAVDKIEIAVGTSGFGFDLSHAGVFTSVGGSGGTDAPDSFSRDMINFVGAFNYNVDNLTAGETSTRLFVVYGPEGTMLENQTATIRISSGTNFMVQGAIIPEPGTFLLMTLGLIGLGVGAGRRGTR